MLKRIEELDHRAMHFVALHRRKHTAFIFKLLTYTAVGPAWWTYALILYYLQWKQLHILPQQGHLLNAIVAPLVAYVVGRAIKRTFQRKRPMDRLENYQAWVRSPKDDSFLSIHAGSTFAFWMALACMQHPLAPYVSVWAALTTFSRYYLGVHFPSDIVAGVALGIACGYAIGILV